MKAISRIIHTLENGVLLDVAIEELTCRAYVVISEPDLEHVADFVPASQFEQDGDVHVTAVASPSEARQQVEDLAFNMNIGDAAVFLCQDDTAYQAILEELGQDQLPH
ncbi:hypothetical protein [Pusillimonas sp.]|uniref:hypothetical protein n=1 Tax=Pusillimonas sp. TaxID=3040095 RepID=UPI0037C5B61E